MEHSDFSAHQVIHECTHTLFHDAQANNVELITDIDPSLNHIFFDDPADVRQTLNTLLRQALQIALQDRLIVHAYVKQAQAISNNQQEPLDTHLAMSRASKKEHRLCIEMEHTEATSGRLGIEHLCHQHIDPESSQMPLEQQLPNALPFFCELPIKSTVLPQSLMHRLTQSPPFSSAPLEDLLLIASSPEQFQSSCDRFINTSTDLMRTLKTSVHQQDWQRVHETAHQLKSSTGAIGGEACRMICEFIERASEPSVLSQTHSADADPHQPMHEIKHIVSCLDHEFQRLRHQVDHHISQQEAKASQAPSSALTHNTAEALANDAQPNTNLGALLDNSEQPFDEKRRTKVLVVDDDESIRLVIKDILQREPILFLECGSGREALSIIDAYEPELIILDVKLPDISGIDVCNALRRLPIGEITQVIMTTGQDDVESIQQSYAVGATDFITKPINWTIFQHRFKYMLRTGSYYRKLIVSEQRLKHAQYIAHLGDWARDMKQPTFTVSDETLRLHGLEMNTAVASLEALFINVKQKDKQRILREISYAIRIGTYYQVEYDVIINAQSDTPTYRTLLAKGSCDCTKNTSGFLTGTFQDITQYKQAERKIASLAYYDGLTELPNRQKMLEVLEEGIRQYDRFHWQPSPLDSMAPTLQPSLPAPKIALLFIDVDNFKSINDTLGHNVGDDLLKTLATRLKKTVGRCVDIDHYACRLGGDEFVILLLGVTDIELISYVAGQVCKETAKPMNIDNTELIVTPSIGISLFPDHGSTCSDLLKNADLAMYHAKKMGRNNYQFYGAEMNQKAQERLSIESYLRQAMDQNELLIHYQPVWDVHSGKITNVEALLRWHNPILGEILPEKFIPIAEDTGLIVDIGQWVLKQACRQLAHWRSEHGLDLSMSINLSMIQFRRDDIAQVIADVLQEHQLAGEYLTLELTESVIMNTGQDTVDRLMKLKSLGVRLAVDDFGTGYSSLNYLKQFPLDTLKIDRNFVKDIHSDPNDVAIIQAIIVMAHKLGLKVVAEGVENAAQHSFLIDNHCDYLQGFFIARPKPPESLLGILSP